MERDCHQVKVADNSQTSVTQAGGCVRQNANCNSFRSKVDNSENMQRVYQQNLKTF